MASIRGSRQSVSSTACQARPAGPLALFRGLQQPCQNLRIATEPIRLLDELASLDLKNLHPTATLMVGSAEFERRNETAQCEIANRLESFLDILARGRLAALAPYGVADGLDMESGSQQATVVIDGLFHVLRRLLAFGLVHLHDVIAHRIIVA